MVFGGTLISPFVVPRDTCHKLLGISLSSILNILNEIDRICASQGCGKATLMPYFYLAVLPDAVCKLKDTIFR